MDTLGAMVFEHLVIVNAARLPRRDRSAPVDALRSGPADGRRGADAAFTLPCSAWGSDGATLVDPVSERRGNSSCLRSAHTFGGAGSTAGGADLYRVSGDGGAPTCACAEFSRSIFRCLTAHGLLSRRLLYGEVSNLGLSHLSSKSSIPVLTAIYPPVSHWLY